MLLRIGLVGDHDPSVVAHRAIPRALELAALAAKAAVTVTWIGTETIDPSRPALFDYHGLWCVPATPYRSAHGAIAAVRFARERGVPFLGTCGGFQHAVLEIAEALWGFDAPSHAELDASAPDPVIAPLACGLVEVSGRVTFAKGSKLAEAYGTLSAEEGYHCRYGLSEVCRAHLDRGPLRATAWDADGDVRGAELDGHPFFVGTLFQPERAALEGRLPPIVGAFVGAASATRGPDGPRSAASI
jgi:CTP synthase (UTP-ammonia lyase)